MAAALATFAAGGALASPGFAANAPHTTTDPRTLTRMAAALAPATTVPADARSATHGALEAYRAFLGALTATEPVADLRDHAVVVAVGVNCPGALGDLRHLGAGRIDTQALQAFGAEVDADLALAYLSPDGAALAGLQGALAPLHWSTGGQSAVAGALIGAEAALAHVAGPNLCADATTLDTAPLGEAASTRRFLARFTRAMGQLTARTSAFRVLIGRYSGRSDAATIAAINTLADRYGQHAEAVGRDDAAAVLTILGD